MRVTREEAKRKIHETNGRIFGAAFHKKDGSWREMNCRLGVKKHLKGGPRAYNPEDYDLVFVYDLQKEGYRSIPINRLVKLNIGGDEIHVEA